MSEHTYDLLLENLTKEKEVFVDLDGTLVTEELTNDYLRADIKKRPHYMPWYLYQLALNNHQLKLQLAQLISAWTYRSPLLKTLQDIKKQTNVKLILITGSCQTLGDRVAQDCKIFDQAIGSHKDLKCIGLNKVDIMQQYNPAPFYIGNSYQDVPIFRNTKKGCLITTNTKLQNKVRKFSSDIIILDQ